MAAALLGLGMGIGDIGQSRLDEQAKEREHNRDLAKQRAAEALRRETNLQDADYRNKLAIARQEQQNRFSIEQQKGTERRNREEWERRQEKLAEQPIGQKVGEDGILYNIFRDNRVEPFTQTKPGYTDEDNSLRDPEFGLRNAYTQEDMETMPEGGRSLFDILKDQQVPFTAAREKSDKLHPAAQAAINAEEKRLENLYIALAEAVDDEERMRIQIEIEDAKGALQRAQGGTGARELIDVGLGTKDKPGTAGPDLRKPEANARAEAAIRKRMEEGTFSSREFLEEAVRMGDPDQTSVEEAEEWYTQNLDTIDGIWSIHKNAAIRDRIKKVARRVRERHNKGS